MHNRDEFQVLLSNRLKISTIWEDRALRIRGFCVTQGPSLGAKEPRRSGEAEDIYITFGFQVERLTLNIVSSFNNNMFD